MSLEKEKIKITPSMFRPKRLYTITINPEEQYEQHNDRIERVVKLTKRRMDKLSLQYNIYVELSNPLSPTKHRFPRVHFHGLIMFETPLQIAKWYNEDYFKLASLGYFEIDTLGDINTWHTYCTKEQDIMKTLTKLSHITSLRPPPLKNNVDIQLSGSA